MALHVDSWQLIISMLIRHNLNPLLISRCKTFYLVKYIRRTDLISISCENIPFPSLFADGDVSRSSSRNVPGGEERGETDVFAG